MLQYQTHRIFPRKILGKLLPEKKSKEAEKLLNCCWEITENNVQHAKEIYSEQIKLSAIWRIISCNI